MRRKSTIPARPSLMCFLSKGDTRSTISSRTCIGCLYVWFIFVTRLIKKKRILKIFADLCLYGIIRTFIEVCFHRWYNPSCLTGIKALTDGDSGVKKAVRQPERFIHPQSWCFYCGDDNYALRNVVAVVAVSPMRATCTGKTTHNLYQWTLRHHSFPCEQDGSCILVLKSESRQLHVSRKRTAAVVPSFQSRTRRPLHRKI